MSAAPRKGETWELALLRSRSKSSTGAQRSQVGFILRFQ